MEIGTGLATVGGAICSLQLIEKILGPTADYLGEGLRSWTEVRAKNIGRIFEVARLKLGDRIEEKGAVPPRVLKQVIEDGSYCDDQIAAEYFGGVLASSRSEISRDDRAAVLIALIGQISSYQIRAHCFFYEVIHTLFFGRDDNIAAPEGRRAMEVFVPLHAFVAAMEFTANEDVGTIINHVMFGLSRESLIDNFSFGSKEHLQKRHNCADSQGIIFRPTVLGAELFLWAHGKGHLHPNQIVEASQSLELRILNPNIVGVRGTREQDAGTGPITVLAN